MSFPPLGFSLTRSCDLKASRLLRQNIPTVQHCPSEAKVSMKSAALQGLLAQLKQQCGIVYCAKASKKLEFGSGTALKSASIEEIKRALSCYRTGFEKQINRCGSRFDWWGDGKWHKRSLGLNTIIPSHSHVLLHSCQPLPALLCRIRAVYVQEVGSFVSPLLPAAEERKSVWMQEGRTTHDVFPSNQEEDAGWIFNTHIHRSRARGWDSNQKELWCQR